MDKNLHTYRRIQNLLLRPEEGLDPAGTWPWPVELEHSVALGSAPG